MRGGGLGLFLSRRYLPLRDTNMCFVERHCLHYGEMLSGPSVCLLAMFPAAWMLMETAEMEKLKSGLGEIHHKPSYHNHKEGWGTRSVASSLTVSTASQKYSQVSWLASRDALLAFRLFLHGHYVQH